MSLKPGIYRITSVASGTNVRVYKINETLFVSSTKEHPRSFELFEFIPAEGGYYIKNVGLQAFLDAPVPDPGWGIFVDPPLSKQPKTIFEASKAGPESYVLKIWNQDLLWTVQPPIIPRGDINLNGANGSDTQKFTFESAKEL